MNKHPKTIAELSTLIKQSDPSKDRSLLARLAYLHQSIVNDEGSYMHAFIGIINALINKPFTLLPFFSPSYTMHMNTIICSIASIGKTTSLST